MRTISNGMSSPPKAATAASRIASRPAAVATSATTVANVGGQTAANVAAGAAAGDEQIVPCEGFFVAIGHAPASELVKDQLPLHNGGYVKVEPGSTRTAIAGVFAAGDLTDHVYRQAITSAGTGCMAALDAQRFLEQGR